MRDDARKGQVDALLVCALTFRESEKEISASTFNEPQQAPLVAHGATPSMRVGDEFERQWRAGAGAARVEHQGA